MTRFELATSAPPVQRSNQAEPHPVEMREVRDLFAFEPQTLPKRAPVR